MANRLRMVNERLEYHIKVTNLALNANNSKLHVMQHMDMSHQPKMQLLLSNERLLGELSAFRKVQNNA